MRFIFQFWRLLLLPHKFYGGGGGGTKTVEQSNPEERALAEISDEKWVEYKSRFAPKENQWIEQVKGLNDPIQHNRAASMVSNEIKAQQGQTTPTMSDSMQGRRFGQGDYLDGAKATSRARVGADQGVTDRYLKGVEGVIAMGQGQSTDAIQGLSDVAETSVRAQMNDANNRFTQKQADLGTVGTVAGAGMAAAANGDYLKSKFGGK